MTTSIPVTESFKLDRPLDVRAHSYLGDNDQGTAHTHAWPDVLRSCEKNQTHVAYDQIAHHHRQGESCTAKCMVFLGLGTCSASGAR